MRDSIVRRISTTIAVVCFSWPALASAQSETVSITGVAGTGCQSDQFHVTVARTNLDGNPYRVHFVASVSAGEVTETGGTEPSPPG